MSTLPAYLPLIPQYLDLLKIKRIMLLDPLQGNASGHMLIPPQEDKDLIGSVDTNGGKNLDIPPQDNKNPNDDDAINATGNQVIPLHPLPNNDENNSTILTQSLA